MAADWNKLVQLIIADKKIPKYKTSVEVQNRMSEIINNFIDSLIPTNGLATGTFTTGPVTNPGSIPGSAFEVKILGSNVQMKPCSGGIPQMNTELHIGIGQAIANVKTSHPIIGSLPLSSATTFQTPIPFPEPSNVTTREKALEIHLARPLCTWLDIVIPALIIPVTGTFTPGTIFNGMLTGLQL